MTTRRGFLKGTAAVLGGSAIGSGLPVFAGAPNRHKFILYFAMGGWDTTKLFWPPWDLTNDDPEEGASERSAHGITYVDHPDRPAVRRFFDYYGDATCVLNGMLVRSVNHIVCSRLVLTGASNLGLPDWPSIIGSHAGGAHALPSIVLSGPTSPGPLHRFSSIVGFAGQVQHLLDRTVFDLGPMETNPPYDAVLDNVDDLLIRRVARRLDKGGDIGEQRMLETLHDSLARVDRLRVDAENVSFLAETMPDQVRTAVRMLGQGIARCITLGKRGFPFDHHHAVDDQDAELNAFFVDLIDMIDLLRITPGSQGGTLADETTILVASEMGRTPWRNSGDGKDHWPYTSYMLVGAGVNGGRALGGYDDTLNALPMDLASGAIDPKGTVVTPNNLGATLLSLAGIDPGLWVPDYAPITASLA